MFMLLDETFLIIQISIFLALLVVYGMFLCYRLFKRKERLEYLAYIMALFPFAYLWMSGVDYLTSIFILLVLWTVCLGRDLWACYGIEAVKQKKKDTDIVNSIVLYAASAGLFFLFAAIIPYLNSDLVNPATHTDIQHWENIIYLPIIDRYVNPQVTANKIYLIFTFLLAADIFMMIIPMLHEIKISNARIAAGPNIFLAICFALPTTYVFYTWIAIPLAMIPVGLILGVLYFAILLTYTKGKEVKKKQVP
ncbi:MAG TPA: hypothetical protein VKM55_16565 [Candidatus Lokiarchaeia archaeon]|nr:hypothetical protein [Candidatus Lokiarchaeia archaeon]